MIILSVIIPVYNTEAYLDRCISSVIVPEVLSKIEILVVNDGSTDGSLAIAQKYQKLYPETIKVFDKSNGGKGSCMNLGLEMATGKYFRELDSDDYLNKKVVAEYVDLLEKLDVDIVATLRRTINSSGRTLSFYLFDKVPQNEIIDLNNFVFADYNADELKLMHNVTHKTQVFKSNSIRFQERISYTDNELVFFGLLYSKTMYFAPYDLYQYFLGREGSSSESTFNKHKVRKRKRDKCLITRRLLDIYNDQYSVLTQAQKCNSGDIVCSILYSFCGECFSHYYEDIDQDVLKELCDKNSYIKDALIKKDNKATISYYRLWKKYDIIPSRYALFTVFKVLKRHMYRCKEFWGL